MSYLQQLSILLPFIFLASFVDSIAGGGGLISLPAYYLVGVDPKLALGTNKFSSSLGTLTSSIMFIKSKKVDFYSVAFAVITAFVGSFLGATIAKSLSDVFLSYFLIVALPLILIFSLKNKEFSKENISKLENKKKVAIFSLLIGFTVGFYDGFFGPGAGVLYMISFNFIGFDIIKSSGNAKIVNFTSNIGSLISYVIGGHVFFALGIPAMIFSILGGYIGSKLAIKNGDKIIKPILIFVVFLLLVKILSTIL